MLQDNLSNYFVIFGRFSLQGNLIQTDYEILKYQDES